jgi:sarcosine oxidase subunit beta
MNSGVSAVIIGAGVEGLSVARALVERGARDVIVFDRGDVGGGMTSLSSGVVRCHYGVRSLAAMAWRSLPVLSNSEEILGGESGFHGTGYVVGVGDVNEEALRANVDMHKSLGIEVELIDHATMAELWPSAKLDDFATFAFEPLGGYGDGYQTAQAFARAARRGGAQIHQRTGVRTIEVQGDRVTGVTLEDGTEVAAEVVIVAAGAWSVDLLSPLGVDVPIRSQRAPIVIIDPGTAIGSFPVFSDLVSLQYVRMEGVGSLLLGDSDHSMPEWVNPDSYQNRVDDDDLATVVPKFQHRFPGYSDPLLQSSYAGCYDVTPDYNPVISMAPVENLLVCAGFSGHGYKISPAVGELVADLIFDGESRHPDIDASDFRLSRFAEAKPLASHHPYVGAGEMR